MIVGDRIIVNVELYNFANYAKSIVKLKYAVAKILDIHDIWWYNCIIDDRNKHVLKIGINAFGGVLYGSEIIYDLNYPHYIKGVNYRRFL